MTYFLQSNIDIRLILLSIIFTALKHTLLFWSILIKGISLFLLMTRYSLCNSFFENVTTIINNRYVHDVYNHNIHCSVNFHVHVYKKCQRCENEVHTQNISMVTKNVLQVFNTLSMKKPQWYRIRFAELSKLISCKYDRPI